MNALTETFEAAMDEAAGMAKPVMGLAGSETYFTAADLMAKEFEEPRWAVNGLLAEGVTVLAGPPKFGKSWLCLGLAVAVAGGGMALGKIPTKQGSVLYCALEDHPRRLQERLALVLGDADAPSDLHIITQVPRLPDLCADLSQWLDEHLDARLIIIDVFGRVRPLGDGRGAGSVYREDYDALSGLKRLADKHRIAVVLVHHTRKSIDEEDVFNEVSGSTGLTGAADAILVAQRARNTSEAALHVTGRDIQERRYGLTWDEDTYQWLLSDEPAEAVDMGAKRRTILAHLTKFPGQTPGEIAKATDLNLNTVKSNVRRMVEDVQLDTDGAGHYFPPTGATDATGATGVAELQGLHSSEGAVAVAEDDS